VKKYESVGAKTRKKKSGDIVAFDGKSPPFPPEAGEGWGTLKYVLDWRAEEKPKTQVKRRTWGTLKAAASRRTAN